MKSTIKNQGISAALKVTVLTAAVLTLSACQKAEEHVTVPSQPVKAVAAAPVPTKAELPVTLSGARHLTALPGGLWLVQTENDVQLVDSKAVLAHAAVKTDKLVSRPLSSAAAVALLEDKNGALQQLDIDLKARTLKLTTLPAPAFAVEGFCLQQSAEGLSAWLLGDEGRGEQWLLLENGVRSVRSLSLPPGSEFCAVDDAAGILYVSEPGTGLWAYSAGIEMDMQRQAVDMLTPFGRLEKSAGAIAVLPDGVLLVDAEAAQARIYRREGKAWAAPVTVALPGESEVEVLSVQTSGNATDIFLRDEDKGEWLHLSWPASAKATAPASALPVVAAAVQTDPVARQGDAADDPAIWIHPRHPEKSLVLGTNKKEGLLVYDLKGREKQKLAVGRLNNVDVRQGLNLTGQRLDLAVATHRDENSLVLFRIAPDGRVSEAGRIATPFKDIYGLCLYQPSADALHVFANDKNGEFIQVQVSAVGKKLEGKEVRRFRAASQPEGCVADDKNHRLFFGEEDKGIWSLSAAADGATTPSLVMEVGEKLVADVEGMAIYHGATASYLVVSSQGNDSYVLLDALPPHAWRGAFRIGMNAEGSIDGASETDGLDVSSAALGPLFPQGVLVVQDGRKRLPEGPQNFKLVSWADIAARLELP